MTRLFHAMIAALLLALAGPATAALPVGARAPDFWTEGSVGGQAFRLHLAEQLRRGPLVLYFYPRAFTEGCTLEARAFSEAMDDFRRLGVNVVGVSADDSETLRRFSVEACRSAFPVATASTSMIDSYDVRLRAGSPMASRTSFLIGRDGRIRAVHSAGDWQGHVPAMLAAARGLQRRR
jgi:thioredoxin-dependent peroxiredoxin